MKARLVAVAATVAAATLFAATPATTARAAPAPPGLTVCTWGGTPAAPTGVITFSPGVTNTPAAEPTTFVASGPLGGGAGCHGTLTFRGSLAPGNTCAVGTPFVAAAEGFPPIHEAVASYGVGGSAAVRLYDAQGNVIGSEQAQFLTTAANRQDPAYTDCGKPGGLRQANWSDTVELYLPKR